MKATRKLGGFVVVSNSDDPFFYLHKKKSREFDAVTCLGLAQYMRVCVNFDKKTVYSPHSPMGRRGDLKATK